MIYKLSWKTVDHFVVSKDNMIIDSTLTNNVSFIDQPIEQLLNWCDERGIKTEIISDKIKLERIM